MEKDINLIIVGETLALVGAVCSALYWKKRYDASTKEGTLWMMNAIEEMENLKKIISDKT